MAKSISVEPKKRGRPATGRDPITGVRLSAELRDGVDAWIAAQPSPRPSRSEAIRAALRDWLNGLGLLKVTDEREDRN